MSEGLLGCPFCGGMPRAVDNDSYGSARVFCPDANDCLVAPTAWGDVDGGGLNEAIAAWNTRTPPPPVSADYLRFEAVIGIRRQTRHIDSVNELLRLINGGANIASIRRANPTEKV